MDGLEGLFAEDVTSYPHGGGIVRVARVSVSGREGVAKLIVAVAQHFWKGMTLLGSRPMDRQRPLGLVMVRKLRLLPLMPQRKASIKSCGS